MKEQRAHQWILLTALAILPIVYFYTTLQRLPKMATSETQIVLHRPKIVIFGDSLTERSFDQGGWGAALQHNYSRKVSSAADVASSRVPCTN